MKAALFQWVVAITIGLLAGTEASGQANSPNASPIQKVITDRYEKLLSKYQDLSYDGLREALPAAPAFRQTLTFEPTDARYFPLIKEELQLTEEEIDKYRRHGFVSIDQAQPYSFQSAYYHIYSQDLPVLVTTDSILHALHKSFSEILQELETTWFTWTLEEALGEVHHALLVAAKEKEAPSLDPNYRDVDLYVTVARNLLAGAGQAKSSESNELAIPSLLGQDEAATDILLEIQTLRMPNVYNEPPVSIYGGTRYIDFSQFRPRGHYNKRLALQNYFQAMMWLGRADCGWNIQPTHRTKGVNSDSIRESRNAVLLTQLLARTGNLENLSSMRQLLEYLVGVGDCLGPFGLHQLLAKLDIDGLESTADSEVIKHIQEAMRQSDAGHQAIRSQIVFSSSLSSEQTPLPTLFQLFGQSLVIDSFVLSKVVFDSIFFENQKVKRMLPVGLDVMAALGNDQAIVLLADELQSWKYSGNLLASRKLLDDFDVSFWRASLYSAWLDALRTLDEDLTNTSHAPECMQTEVWQMKQLQTQLASWAQLRHDTVLYAKQSHSAAASCAYPDGYVEPYPRLYAQLKQLALAARDRLDDISYNSLDERRHHQLGKMKDRHLQFFATMIEHLSTLEQLADKELEGVAFTGEDMDFIGRTINKRGWLRMGSGAGPPTYDGWYNELLYSPTGPSSPVWEPTIADVHTDPGGQKVLEVGVGNLNLCIGAVKSNDELVACVGPIFSYYEFKQPGKRLTDQEWLSMLHKNKVPDRPEWIGSFQGQRLARKGLGAQTHVHRRGNRLRVYVPAKQTNLDIQLSDDSLSELADLTGVRVLDLSVSPISDRALVYLRNWKELRSLNLGSTLVRGDGLTHLQSAKWLRTLVLRNAPVTDEALNHIRTLPNLESLDLSGTRVTNQVVADLVQMKSLRELRLERSGIDNAGAQRLSAELPKCRVYF